MPKIKTHSAAKKKFRLTGTGKVRRYSAYKSHLLGTRSKSRKRRLNRGVLIAAPDMARVAKMLGM